MYDSWLSEFGAIALILLAPGKQEAPFCPANLHRTLTGPKAGLSAGGQMRTFELRHPLHKILILRSPTPFQGR